MKRAVAVLICLSTALFGTVVVQAADATASTFSKSGLYASFPNSKTAFNGHAVSVYPRARVASGVHKKITGKRLTAYSGTRKVSSGSHVRLEAGRYRAQVRVAYRTYRYVTRYRTVRVHHDGGMPDGSVCTVTAVEDYDSDGVGDYPTTADCANQRYPNQTVHEDNPLPNHDASSYAIGDMFVSDFVEYEAYSTTTRVAHHVRQYSSTHTWTTAKRTLLIKDGGHLRYWSDNDSYTTDYHRYPKGAKIFYNYDTNYSGSCYFGLNAEIRSGGYDDLVDQTRRHGHGGFKLTRAVSLRFDVITSCDWQLEVRWR